MPDKYYLVESGALEKLLRTHFMLTQSTLLFEHLLSHSDRPMFLSARKVCEVLGPTIASYTRELYIKNQVLYVHLTSAALRQELMMGRDLLVRNLNRHVGAQVITNIIFR